MHRLICSWLPACVRFVDGHQNIGHSDHPLAGVHRLETGPPTPIRSRLSRSSCRERRASYLEGSGSRMPRATTEGSAGALQIQSVELSRTSTPLPSAYYRGGLDRAQRLVRNGLETEPDTYQSGQLIASLFLVLVAKFDPNAAGALETARRHLPVPGSSLSVGSCGLVAWFWQGWPLQAGSR